MQYYQLYDALKELYSTEQDYVESSELGIEIFNYDFLSQKGKKVLYGSDDLSCGKHHIDYQEEVTKGEIEDHLLGCPDFNIKQNERFKVSVIKTQDVIPATGVIVMFHGLNEKKWDKYLPWAYELAKQTGKAIVLFPISFHMDRTPAEWSDRKLMFGIAQKRAEDWKTNSDTSYVNAAISTRMEDNPLRLFWSGLQTYYDFIQWVEEVKKGTYPTIDKNATIDLFGYSIGSFLSLIILMANPKGLLDSSKLLCYCGGMTIDRMAPISKYIMDARATIMMQKTFAQLLTTSFVSEPRLEHYQDILQHPEESWFRTMLRYYHYQENREKRFKELEGRIKSINLMKDDIAPPVEALNTLQGAYRTINIEVDVIDYPFNYSHMIPFPLTVKNADEVTEAFNLTMDKMVSFYKK
ncbi:DUF6051 family protein [Myroides phaeus]|uniref:DUF6051 family protein n=1 Tax=Myroides phaeus TaxID=702745 RepID=UPI002DB9A68A|nr:DUF6051 family protein [Myroides phaeus]MEC4117751.1 DUF6051 family protein [Myroides phaeus]